MSPSPDHILLTDKVAVVTGAAQGIGAATAAALARFGADVAIVDRDADGLAATEEVVRAHGRRVLGDVFDVRDPAAVDAFLDRVVGAFGPVDVLVNNVGGGFHAPFTNVSPNAEAALVAENFGTVTATIRSSLEHLAPGASIVNITSVEAHHASPGFAVYGAMKAAVEQFTKSLAVELGGRGIRVNAVAPDMIPTPGDAALAETSGALSTDRHPTPLGRVGTADECASVVVFLASELSSFVTGASIPVDGGTLAAGPWKATRDGGFRL